MVSIKEREDVLRVAKIMYPTCFTVNESNGRLTGEKKPEP
jgi:hypothetical protein